jgi:hypothetical protein
MTEHSAQLAVQVTLRGHLAPDGVHGLSSAVSELMNRPDFADDPDIAASCYRAESMGPLPPREQALAELGLLQAAQAAPGTRADLSQISQLRLQLAIDRRGRFLQALRSLAASAPPGTGSPQD